MSRPVSSQVAVIGGGVIGAACARAAAARGLKTTLFEPGPLPAAASSASAGLLAAQIEIADDQFYPLAIRGRDLYAALAPELKDSTGIDIGFESLGIASLALDEAGARILEAQVALQRQAGLRCDWLTATDVQERWPGLTAECQGALFSPEDGALDPPALTSALLADAKRKGVVVKHDKIAQVDIDGGRVTGVRAGSRTIACEHVVVAAGAWSPELRGLPRRLPIEPMRGQMIATRWPANLPRGVFYHGHGYILPRGTEAIAGSTMEQVGFDSQTTAEGLAHIRRIATTICPAFAKLPDIRSWAGLRPVTPDSLPIVGPDPGVQGLWYATGHGRNGILLAGLTGEVIGELLATGSSSADLTRLSVERFDP